MAELLFTTDTFRPLKRSVPGVPMLLNANMCLIEPACAWLLHIALVRGRTRSAQTWRTYGEALYDWWQTLEANGWAWYSVRFHEVAAYRDYMLTYSSDHTGRPYARATINSRLRILALFYRWCAASGLVTAAPFSWSDVSVARWRPAPFSYIWTQIAVCNLETTSWSARFRLCRGPSRQTTSAALWLLSGHAIDLSSNGLRSPECAGWRLRV